MPISTLFILHIPVTQKANNNLPVEGPQGQRFITVFHSIQNMA